MSLTNTAETAFLALWLTAVTWANIAENDTTGPLANWQLSLHTGDPGETGSQTTSEAAFTSYAREAIARSSSGWTVSGNSGTLTSAVNFTTATGGSETETHFGMGEASSGAGTLHCSGTLTPNPAVSNGVTVQLTTSTAITAD